jgi:hypothetical protein
MSEGDIRQCYNQSYTHNLICLHDASIAREPHNSGVSPLSGAVRAGALSTMTEWQMQVHPVATLWKKN